MEALPEKEHCTGISHSELGLRQPEVQLLPLTNQRQTNRFTPPFAPLRSGAVWSLSQPIAKYFVNVGRRKEDDAVIRAKEEW